METSMAKVLWLSNETPDSNGQGGQRRQFFQVQEIARQGHEVLVCTLAGPQSDTAVRQHAKVIRTRPHWRRAIRAARHKFLEYRVTRQSWTAVVVSHTESRPTFRPMVHAINAPTWVDLHNVLGRDHTGQVTRWRSIESEICCDASVVSVCSNNELQRLTSQQGEVSARVVVVSHGVNPQEWSETPHPAPTKLLKMFGNWAWDPNRRGLEWFLSDVWPQIAMDGVRCEIAGSGVNSSDMPEGVRFVGRVPRLDAWAHDAWAIAVPVLGGVGAPVKYLEALATRVPVIATPDGAPVAQHLATLISPDAGEWVTAIRNLTGHQTGAGQSTLLNRYSWGAATDPLLAWLAGLN